MLAAVTAAVISLCACSAISAQEMSIPLSGSDEYKDYGDYFSGAEESAADAIKLLPESASALENAELVPREDNGGNCLDIAEGGSASWKITGEPLSSGSPYVVLRQFVNRMTDVPEVRLFPVPHSWQGTASG